MRNARGLQHADLVRSADNSIMLVLFYFGILYYVFLVGLKHFFFLSIHSNEHRGSGGMAPPIGSPHGIPK